MASTHVSLPDPMWDYVQQRIDSGHYASVGDYVVTSSGVTKVRRWMSSPG